MAVAHPDSAVREAAKLCEPKVEKFTTALYLDAGVASVLQRLRGKGEKLEGEKKRAPRRHAPRLPPQRPRSRRPTSRQLPAASTTRRSSSIGQKFTVNIGASTGKLELKPSQLAGLPPEYVQNHPVKDGKVVVTTDYPDYFPFVTYAKDRRAALDLYVLFTNRGGEENVKLLDRLLMLRHEKAKLLGYATWADYAIEPRMAKTPRDRARLPRRGEGRP